MKVSAGNKVVLIGAGDVGVAYAYALVNQGTCDHLAIIDIDERKTEGNVMDLNHGVVWAPSRTKVTRGTYADCEDAALVVICAGAAQKPGETRLQLVDKNMRIFKSIVGDIMASGFDGIILVATNPVDILTHATWKFSGLPAHRVIGSGTVLDTARFRYMLGEYFEVSPMSVHAYIVGEHGDSELPVLSSANIAGVGLRSQLEKNPELHDELEAIFIRTRDAAYEIIDAKGSTSYGIGMGLARITRAIFQNQEVALPVSALLRGEYGHEDMYIGTPAIVNRKGVRRVVELELDEYETEQFNKSVETLRAIQDPFWKDGEFVHP
ncbi:L-lactate dehydrogenase [Corynebacterium hansenii]|uniref:L-lactate dehydrogenase n=1 Tax=Corynebacterium hansenii TaxID=394964 RepID=A0ABV7ZR55_9CORY|nr:L-lactate dehydrogenase [Corynebacterium hansenii]WJZ01255.1 L-lactate dehydrogenase P [Corynebacterium hansenii]